MKNVANTNVVATKSSPDAIALAFPPTPIIDNGHVRLGAQSPLFTPETIADAGKMGRGAQSPVFTAGEIADSGLVRLGAQSPVL